MEQSATQHQELVQEISNVGSYLELLRAESNENFGALRGINFAQWRDGQGPDYWRKYRPLAKKYIEAIGRISSDRASYTANRSQEIAGSFREQKDPNWLDEAFSLDVFIPRPQVVPPSQIHEAPESESSSKLN